MGSEPKSFQLSESIHRYLLENGGAPDSVGQALIERTRELGRISIMQIAPEQGAFISLLASAIGARRAIEVGTFTGFSALCIARGMGEGGELICCDTSEEWTSLGRPFWEEAGVADRIDLRIAPAIETLRSIEEDAGFDLAFIDADKSSYIAYAEELLRLIRPGGLILVDNVLWFGAVADPEINDERTLQIRAFNEWATAHPRCQNVMLPIGDGLTLIRVL
ncbi:MAG: class I SAM-dependent methyltransferase [Myxococcota bacterium]|nr:class I SAM-dependent methyltransferase [Myxococcota bacterium]